MQFTINFDSNHLQPFTAMVNKPSIDQSALTPLPNDWTSPGLLRKSHTGKETKLILPVSCQWCHPLSKKKTPANLTRQETIERPAGPIASYKHSHHFTSFWGHAQTLIPSTKQKKEETTHAWMRKFLKNNFTLRIKDKMCSENHPYQQIWYDVKY